MDVFVFPSRYRFEAQPIVLIEALSHGIPVLAPTIGYISELLGFHEHEITELRPEAAIESLKSFLNDKARYLTNARSSKKRFIDLRRASRRELKSLMTAINCPYKTWIEKALLTISDISESDQSCVDLAQGTSRIYAG